MGLRLGLGLELRCRVKTQYSRVETRLDEVWNLQTRTEHTVCFVSSTSCVDSVPAMGDHTHRRNLKGDATGVWFLNIF